MAEIKLHADEVSIELTPEQARLARLIDKAQAGQFAFRQRHVTLEELAADFEDEAQALRSKALEEMRGSA